ncbi:MAG: hypothetical protein JNK45_31495, partial [Myxococcales bacterium]|nr:hypothetical protein [Myxococcales bacterium]
MKTPRFRRGALAVAALLPACSSIAADAPVTTGSVQDSSGDSSAEDESGDDDDEDDPHGTAGTPDDDTSGGGDSSSGDPPAPSAGFPVCPEPLPPSWVLC